MSLTAKTHNVKHHVVMSLTAKNHNLYHHIGSHTQCSDVPYCKESQCLAPCRCLFATKHALQWCPLLQRILLKSGTILCHNCFKTWANCWQVWGDIGRCCIHLLRCHKRSTGQERSRDITGHGNIQKFCILRWSWTMWAQEEWCVLSSWKMKPGLCNCTNGIMIGSMMSCYYSPVTF